MFERETFSCESNQLLIHSAVYSCLTLLNLETDPELVVRRLCPFSHPLLETSVKLDPDK